MDRPSIGVLARTRAWGALMALGVIAAIALGACSGAASPTPGVPSVAPSTGASTPRPSLLSSAPSATATASPGAAIVAGAILNVSTSGSYLTGAGGLTLYAYFPSGLSGPTGFAPRVSYSSYPPFNVPAGTLPVLGPGVIASKVGTAPDPGGAVVGMIVTYGGAPLYYCTLAPAPGDISCNALSGGHFRNVLP